MIHVWMPPGRSNDPDRDKDGIHLATGMASTHLVCLRGWNQYLWLTCRHSDEEVYAFAEEQIKLEEAREVLSR